MKQALFLSALLLIFFSANPATAGEGHSHDHGDHSHDKKHSHDDHNHGHDEHGSSKMFLKKQEIDGYTVSFHVMEATDNMRHGGTHNFMIKVEKDGKVLKDVLINSKVIHPNGHSETKGLMRMGDWYMNGYDLGHDGDHQLMILFKTADGVKHKGGVFYSGS